MGFQSSWFIGSEAAEPAYAEAAATLRAFLESDPSSQGAREVIALGEPAVKAMVDVLLDRKDGLRLAHLRDTEPPKALRKLIGLAVHKLESRGIVCRVPEPQIGKIAYLEETYPSYMSRPDLEGYQFLVLADKTGTGAWSVVVCLADRKEGIFQLLPADAGRARLKRILEDLSGRGHGHASIPYAEAPAPLVRRRIREAAAIHRGLGKPLPKEWGEVAGLIEHGPAEDAHPAHALLGPADARYLTQAEGLLGEYAQHDGHEHYHAGDLELPIPGDAWLEANLPALEAAATSPLLVTREQRVERVQDEIARLLRTYADATVCATTAEIALDAAYVLARTGREDAGRAAYATAIALVEPGRDPVTVPWALAAFNRLFDVSQIVDQAALKESL